MLQYKDQRVGVFIDVQNMYYSARNLYQRKVNFSNVVEVGVGDRKLVRAIAYVVTTKSGEEGPFLEALKKHGIKIKEKELSEYFSGQKKADWDVGIAVDVVQALDLLDVVILVSGDGDFLPLVHYVQSRGRQVEVISFRESTSSKLVEAVDGYTDMSKNKRKFLIGTSMRFEAGEAIADEESEIIGEAASLDEPKPAEERRSRKISF